jgi:hypothetical protein
MDREPEHLTRALSQPGALDSPAVPDLALAPTVHGPAARTPQMLLALQRAVGNAAVGALIAGERALRDPAARVVQRDDIPAAPPTSTSAPTGMAAAGPGGASGAQIEISLATEDSENFGHAWIMLNGVPPAGGAAGPPGPDSYGFWPAGKGADGLDFLLNHALPGMVVHPDTNHSPEAKDTTNIDQAGYTKGLAVADSYKGRKYIPWNVNCTTFAKEFWQTATGTPPPDGKVLIDRPSELQDAIKNGNKQRGLDPLGNPLGAVGGGTGGSAADAGGGASPAPGAGGPATVPGGASAPPAGPGDAGAPGDGSTLPPGGAPTPGAPGAAGGASPNPQEAILVPGQ